MIVFLHKINQHRYYVLSLLFLVLVSYFLPEKGLFFPSFKDSFHTLVFALGTYLLLIVLLPTRPSVPKVIGICFFSFSVGIFIEFIQPYIGRNRSMVDVYNDFAGCSAAGFLYGYRLCHSVVVKRVVIIAGCVCLLSGMVFPISNLYLLHQRNSAQPVLINFDRDWEVNLVALNAVTELRVIEAPNDWGNNTNVAEVTFGAGGSYPGLVVPYIYNDWTGYANFSFEVFSAQSEAVSLKIRIHDGLHQNQFDDRFNLTLNVQPGLNRFELSLEDVRFAPKLRELQLDDIESVAFFMVKPEYPTVLFFDNLVLN